MTKYQFIAAVLLLSVPSSAVACWDGHVAGYRQVTLTGSERRMRVDVVFDLARRLVQFDALGASVESLGDGGSGNDTLMLPNEPDAVQFELPPLTGRLASDFEFIASTLAVPTDRQRAAQALEPVVYTVQLASSGNLHAAQTFRDRIRGAIQSAAFCEDRDARQLFPQTARRCSADPNTYFELAGQSFVEFGGFPARNDDTSVVSEGGTHRVISGLFLEESGAHERCRGLRAAGATCFVRALRPTEVADMSPEEVEVDEYGL